MESKVRRIAHAAEIEITSGTHAGQVVAVPFDYAPDAELVAPAIVELVGTLSVVQHIDALHDATGAYLNTPGLDGAERVRHAGGVMVVVVELLRGVGVDV